MCRIALIISLVIICAHSALGLSGMGTEAEPWRIETAADFHEFAGDENYWDDYTRLETDVNLAGITYTTAVIAPEIDNSNYVFDGTAFTGVFDGNDKRITNLTINGGDDDDYLGLFGCIGIYGEVKNLGLEGGSITGGEYYVGGLVGSNYGSISNCYSTADVSDDSIVGGLVGRNDTVGIISSCYSTGSVSGEERIGGLVGLNVGSVSYCYSIGDVSGDDYVGGLVGGNTRVYYDLYSRGVFNCYSTSDVNGVFCVGGLVAENGSEIFFHSPGYIYNSYSKGAVEGISWVGGLVGIHVGGDIEESFWDIETSEQLESDGGTGKTTVEMQTKSTFTDAGWDFLEIWDIGEKQTYPYLRQYLSGDLNHDGIVNMIDFAILAGHWLGVAGQ